MRRIVSLLTVLALMAMMTAAMAAPAFAGIIIEPNCKNQSGIDASQGRAKCAVPRGEHRVATAGVSFSSANVASIGVGAPLLVISGLLAYRMVRSKN